MASDLFTLLGYCGFKGKNLEQRRRLIDFAWQNCEHKTPYILDQLLTHGGVFTQIRLLVIVARFGYERACGLYPVLDNGEIPPPDTDIPAVGTDMDADLDEISEDFSGYEEMIDQLGIGNMDMVKGELIEDEE